MHRPPAVIFALDWLVLPLAAAATLAMTRWGKDNLALMIGVPLFVLCWRMWRISQRLTMMWREQFLSRATQRSTTDSTRAWHALCILACVFLMAFEGGVAALAEARQTSVGVWLTLSVCTYVPYVVLNDVAERLLRVPVRAS